MRGHLSTAMVAATAAVTLLALGGPASAAPATVVDRGLPTANLNNAAGSDRSNVAWSQGNDQVTGDTVSVGSAGESWVVTGIRTWNIGHAGTSFAADFSDTTLYFGTGGVAPVSGADVTHTPVTYTNGEGYQGTSGTSYRLWQNDFSNLALDVDGGQTYYVAVDGTPVSPSFSWFNHASNAALSGSPQEASDGHYVTWAKSDLGSPIACDSAGGAGPCDGGWDKSSDINVQLLASQVATDNGACKKGGWQSLVRADGTGFKNQGDCIQYVNTGK